MKSSIKLILWDFNGVTVVGDHTLTSKHFGKKHHAPWRRVYAILYTKYFNQLALNTISEQKAWSAPLRELGWHEDWRAVRRWHLGQQRLRTTVIGYVQSLRRRGYQCVLFSKNYEPWVKYQERRLHFSRYFDDVLNTQKYNLPKASQKTIRFVCRRYAVKPEEIIYIDDQRINLIEAQKLGVQILHYRTFKQTRHQLTKLLLRSATPE
ncbi:MAG: HAD hydrolase-like protein [Patescibacteria group bacterium]